MTVPAVFRVDVDAAAVLPVGTVFHVCYAPQSPALTLSQRDWCVVAFTVVAYERWYSHVYLGMTTGYREDGWWAISEMEAMDLWQSVPMNRSSLIA